MIIPLELKGLPDTIIGTSDKSLEFMAKMYDDAIVYVETKTLSIKGYIKEFLDKESVKIEPNPKNRVNRLNERWLRFQNTMRTIQASVLKRLQILTGNVFVKKILHGAKVLAKTVTKMAKSLYGGWFTRLLQFLLFLAIFDPKGKFLKSILGFITSMALQLVGVILDALPSIFNAFKHIVTKVLPSAIGIIVDMVFSFVRIRLLMLLNSIESPFLKWVIQKLADLFSPGGVISTFIKNVSVVFIPIFIMVGILVKFASVFMVIGKAIALTFVILKKIFLATMVIIKFVSTAVIMISKAIVFITKGIAIAIKGFLFVMKIVAIVIKAVVFGIKIFVVAVAIITGAPALLVVAIIAGIMAVIALVYVYWDKVKAFLSWAVDWIIKGVKFYISLWVMLFKGLVSVFSSIWKGLKIIVVTAGEWIKKVIMAYINMWVTILTKIMNTVIKGAKLFVHLVTNIPVYLKLAWEAILEWVVELGETITKFVRKMIDTMLNPFRAALRVIRPMIDSMIEAFQFIGEILGSLGNVLSSMWSIIKDTILTGIQGVKTAFETIFDWIAMVSELGIRAFVGPGASQIREEFLEARRAGRDEDMNLGRIQRLLDSGVTVEEARSDLNAQEMQVFQERKEAKERGEDLPPLTTRTDTGGGDSFPSVQRIKITTTPRPIN